MAYFADVIENPELKSFIIKQTPSILQAGSDLTSALQKWAVASVNNKTEQKSGSSSLKFESPEPRSR